MQGTKLSLSPQLHLQGMHRETEAQEPGRGKPLQGQDACPQTGVSLCPGTQANIGQVGPRHTARRPEQGSWLCPASVLPRDQDPDLCAGQWAERVLSQERRPWAGSEEGLRGQGSFQKRHCGQALGRKPRAAQVGRKEAQSQAGVALRRGGWRQEAGGGAEKQEGRSRQGCVFRAPAHKPTACCCHCPVCPVAFAAVRSLLRWGQSQEGWRRLGQGHQDAQSRARNGGCVLTVVGSRWPWPAHSLPAFCTSVLWAFSPPGQPPSHTPRGLPPEHLLCMAWPSPNRAASATSCGSYGPGACRVSQQEATGPPWPV